MAHPGVINDPGLHKIGKEQRRHTGTSLFNINLWLAWFAKCIRTAIEIFRHTTGGSIADIVNPFSLGECRLTDGHQIINMNSV